MRSTLLPLLGLAGAAGLMFLVDFLGAPARANSLEASMRFRPMESDGARVGASGLPEGTATTQEADDLGSKGGTVLGSILGRVVDSKGAPIPDARVVLSDIRSIERRAEARAQGPHEGLREVETLADGSFRIGALAPGYVRIWASENGGPWSWTRRVEVRAQQECYALELCLESDPEGDSPQAPE